jgi:hypothetical protein
LPNGDLLVLRDIVIDAGHMKTIEVVLVHPDRSGIGAEAGNWTIGAADPTPISQGEVPTPVVVTRPEPLYTVDQLAQLVLAVDERVDECMRRSCQCASPALRLPNGPSRNESVALGLGANETRGLTR